MEKRQPVYIDPISEHYFQIWDIHNGQALLRLSDPKKQEELSWEIPIESLEPGNPVLPVSGSTGIMLHYVADYGDRYPHDVLEFIFDERGEMDIARGKVFAAFALEGLDDLPVSS